MKKASTWYLLALLVLNVLLAFGVSALIERIKISLKGWGGGLPNETILIIEYYWWPRLFVALTGVLAVLSIFSKWPSRVFYHFIIVCLILECAILFFSQFGIIALLPIFRP
jgi:hypothetical protein